MRPKNVGARVKYPYQPTLGVKTDFERLLQTFSSAGTVRYEKFAECWREQNMACFCAGRQSKRETREFVEQCFHIATQFWLPPSSFLVRAGALYLLYGLYHYQLVLPKVKIRVTPEQWRTINEYQEEAREQQHLDLDYVFQKLLLDKAFQFVATPEEVNLKQRGSDDSKIIPDSMKEETSMLDEIFSSSSLNQLSLVHDQYQKMKLALNDEDSPEPDTSLNIVHSDLISGIYKTLQTHKVRQAGLKSQNKERTFESIEEEEGMSTTESQSLKKQLKLRAFEQSTGGYRELPGRGEKHRHSEDETVPSEDSGQIEQKAVSNAQSRGQRKQKRSLFDKDEGENAPVQIPEVHELFCMPDLDAIIPKPLIKTESKISKDDADIGSSEEKEEVGEIPAGKGDTETVIETGRDITEQEVNKGTETVDKHIDNNDGQVKKKKNNKGTENKGTEKISNNKKPEVAETVNESVSEAKKNKTSAKKAKTVAANTGGKRKKSTETAIPDNVQGLKEDLEGGEAKEDKGEKELTAQEKLQMKLTQRKKEARLKSAKDNKKGKKKS